MNPKPAKEENMTVCPIALAVHCTGCPLVKICPAKTILGDYDTYAPAQDEKDAEENPGPVEDVQE